MGKIVVAWIYLSSFFNVVVLNCIKPVNWKNCENPQEWLFPEIHRGIKFMFEPNIYESERESLRELEGENDPVRPEPRTSETPY